MQKTEADCTRMQMYNSIVIITMYTEEDLKGLSIEELINLVNQITEERNLYRDKCNKLIEQKQNHVETRRTVKDIIDSMSDVC